MSPRDAEETRNRILDAAGRLFYRDGVRPVAMDLVAGEAGVTKRTLYYHFDSKDDLVVAYLRRSSERVLASLVKHEARADAAPMARLLRFFDDFAARLSHERFRGCPFINAVTELTDSDPIRIVAARHKESVRAWFESLLVEMNAREPHTLSEQLMLLTDGAIATWVTRRDSRAAVQARDAAVVLIAAATANQ